MHGLFVTGTDTGVGKTLVAGGILSALRESGIDAVPMKPVQTGARPADGRLTSPDLEVCLRMSGLSASRVEKDLMCPYRYRTACSPHLAGRVEGGCPDIPTVVRCARELAEAHDALVVEGVGGVLVPLDEQHTVLDLMEALALPVVLVARGGLGTINHSLLSIRALRSAGLRVLGVVMNDPSPTDEKLVRDDNPAIVQHMSGVPVLGDIRHIDAADDRARESAFRRTFCHAVAGLDVLIDEMRRLR